MAKRDIDFLFEIGSLRNVPRAWQQVLTSRAQNTSLEKEAKVLFKEYNDRKSLEAKIVKDADNIDVDLELKELARIGDSAAVSYQKGHRPTIRAKKFYTQTAKRMYDEIKNTDINTWHNLLTNKWVQNKKGAR